MKHSIFVIIFVLTFGVFNIVQAQNVPSQTTINVDLIPETPRAGDIVVASLTSYATDINSALITWKINGKIMKSGIGEREFTFTVGGVNTKTTLGITIKTNDGETIEKSLIIKPSEIDLIWQSKSLVPPFYKGKAMFSHQNEITFIAIPHIIGSNGQEIGIRNLVYRWKKNGSVIEDASGFGKNTYTFEGSLISRPLDVEVEAYSPTQEGFAHSYTTITPGEPTVLIYKKDPTYGIGFQKTLLNTVQLDGTRETTLVGFPLFYGANKSSSNELLFKWSINGVPIGDDFQTRNQTFRQKEGVTGYSNISLSIENENKILQYASRDFKLKFQDLNIE